MKKISVVFNRKYLFDGVLIVFSVLFALFINKVAENIQTNKDKGIALENIKMEIHSNAEILKEWQAFHLQVRDRITSIIEGENDSLRLNLLKYNFLNVGVLTDKENLIHSNISKTAWETAKSTGIISEFDFNQTQELTEVYMLQDIITEKTISKLMDFLFDPDTHKIENIDTTLIQLQLIFNELVGQEYLLIQLYEDILSSEEIAY